MPKWTADGATYFQMYETTTEGTSISPVMDSPESLARWLADNKASAFADQTASYDAWLKVCRGRPQTDRQRRRHRRQDHRRRDPPLS
jgi:hypothetical protein